MCLSVSMDPTDRVQPQPEEYIGFPSPVAGVKVIVIFMMSSARAVRALNLQAISAASMLIY